MGTAPEKGLSSWWQSMSVIFFQQLMTTSHSKITI